MGIFKSRLLYLILIGGLVAATLIVGNKAIRYRAALANVLAYARDRETMIRQLEGELAKTRSQVSALTDENKAQLAEAQAEAANLRAEIGKVRTQLADVQGRYAKEIGTLRRQRDLLFVAAYQREEVQILPTDDYESIDRGNFSVSDTADRRQVNCRESVRRKRSAVLFVLGQSNAANTVDGRITPAKGVVNFNLYDGKCYEAVEPLLGSTNYGGSFVTRLANKMIERRAFQSVVIINIAVGGTKVEEWGTDGTFNRRIAVAAKRVQDAQLEPTHVLWHQGEGNVRDSRSKYRQEFLTVFSTLRRHGVYAPIYVAQATICLSSPDEEIRSAQRALVDPAKRILAGPDTDQLGPEYRYDGCHFSSEGADKHAELWYQAIDP